MNPYAGFLYFGVLLYVAVPTIVLRAIGRLPRWWALAATGAMLAVQYGNTVPLLGDVSEAWVVAGWAAFQFGLVRAVLWTRPGARAPRAAPGAMPAGRAPRTAAGPDPAISSGVAARPSVNRSAYRLALALSLAPLAAAKLGLAVGPLAFVGLSYVTFRALDVLIAVGDGLVGAVPAGEYAGYVLFFPSVSAGPIDRFRRFGEDWRRADTRERFLDDVDAAVHRVFTGFLYKFIVAALVKTYWMDPAAASRGLGGTVSFMYAYSAYLFFDFAGYSAFAIGVGRLFGVHTPENFDRPFLARNIREFWDRWHITLSWWFRDQVYMRFVLAATRRRWFASRLAAWYAGFLVSFGLMGLWHGRAPQYLLYGLYHACLLIVHDVYRRRQPRRQARSGWTRGDVGAVLLTAHAVMFGFLIFSGRLTAGWW